MPSANNSQKARSFLCPRRQRAGALVAIDIDPDRSDGDRVVRHFSLSDPSVKPMAPLAFRRLGAVFNFGLGFRFHPDAGPIHSARQEQGERARHYPRRALTKVTTMQNSSLRNVAMVIALMCPLAAYGQSSGGAGGGSAGGAASGPSTGTGSAAGSPNAGSAGAGTAGVSGVPSGPASAGGLNNSANDPSGAGNAAKATTPPGTNSAGTANSSGSPSSGTTTTTGSAGNRAGNRIDGVANPGPAVAGDAEIDAENRKANAKIKSICKGC